MLGANAELTEADIDLDVIASADVLHLGGTYLMSKFDGEPSRRVLEHAKANGVTTTHDLIAIERPDLLDLIEPCLPFVDYFMPGIDEARMIAGLPHASRHELIGFFLDRGAKHTVFKMGAEGSSIAWRESGEIREIRLPAHKVPVVDSTGCGDAYCAGFIVGLTNGWELERCGRLGTAASALVITGLGSDAGIVDLAQTITFMETAAVQTLPAAN